jgi:hypothetical protein
MGIVYQTGGRSVTGLDRTGLDWNELTATVGAKLAYSGGGYEVNCVPCHIAVVTANRSRHFV